MASISETTRLLHPDVEESRHAEDEIVWWENDEDAANPLNWTNTQKWSHVAIVSLLTFLVYVKRLKHLLYRRGYHQQLLTSVTDR